MKNGQKEEILKFKNNLNNKKEQIKSITNNNNLIKNGKKKILNNKNIIDDEKNKINNFISKQFISLTIFLYKEYIILNILIIISLIIPIYSTNSITIKINGTGIQQFLSVKYSHIPTTINFRGTTINPTTQEIEIPETETNENEIILNWDSSSFEVCNYMFYNLPNLIEIDLSNFDIQCKGMRYMFGNNINLKKITFGDFDTSLCEDMNDLFINCQSLVSLNLNNFQTNALTKIDSMFYNCTSLTTLDLSNFNTANINSMNTVFYQCNSLVSLNLNNWDTTSVISMSKMFYGCSSLISLNLNSFVTNLVEDMTSLFDSCKSLKYLEISHFVTSNVKIMTNMFANCQNLISLNLLHFDTSQVTSMNNMFIRCRALTSLDLSNFVTSEVKDMKKMFESCNNLQFLDISNFDTQKVENMGNMFSGCYSLTSLELSGFNTQLVRVLDSMFYNCTTLTSLDLSNFDTSLVVNMQRMFAECRNLIYLNILNFEENSELNNTNMFLNIKGDLVYCINDESNLILSALTEKECATLDCNSNWLERKNDLLETKKNDISIFNDKCVYMSINEISEAFYLSTKISKTAIYSYELNSNSDKIKNKYVNLTYIDFNQDDIDFIYKYFNLDKNNDKIYILMVDSESKDSRTATSDYNFKILLENGTQLNFSNINQDCYVDVSVPIRDLDLANFDYAQSFEGQGYDIYNLSSDFYNDFCSPAFSKDDDIIIKDRKADIYPKNVTFCKDGCKYKNVNIEEKRIVCECNLNSNLNEDENDSNDEEEEGDGNYFTYFVDKINYKIFKCYKLITFEKISKNVAFYAILSVFATIIILSLDFFICGLSKIRIQMHKDLPTDQKVRKMIIEELKKIKQTTKNPDNPPKKKKDYKKNKKDIIKNKKNGNNNTEIFKFKRNKSINSSSSINNIGFFKKKKNSINQAIFIAINPLINKNNKINKNVKTEGNVLNEPLEHEQEKKGMFNEYNDLPLSKAKKIDKRNIFKIFISILFSKLELVGIFTNKEKIRVICICEYILSLLFGFFLMHYFIQMMLFPKNIITMDN